MSITMLVVDDSKSVRMSLTEVLSHLGYEVVVAASAEEAITLVTEGLRVDMVMTDLYMPGKNGIQLIEALRAQEGYQFIPMFVLSTESHTEVRTKAKQAGATGWLVKPVKMAQLVDIVKQVMPS